MSFLIWGADHLGGVPSQRRFLLCRSEGGTVLPYMAGNGHSEGARPFLTAGLVHCVRETRNNSRLQVEGWSGPRAVKGNFLTPLKGPDHFFGE